MSTQPPAVVYWMPIAYPNAKAHSIQVTRTVHALSARLDVHLVVQRGRDARPWRERVREAYGIEARPGLHLVELPAAWLREPLVPLALRALARRVRGPQVFYARRYPIASSLLRWRALHRRPLVFETHKKEGFRKEDRVEGSPFAKLRDSLEAANHSFRLLRRVYCGADALVFLHEHSLKAAQQRLPLRRALALWHGLDRERMQLGGPRPRDLVFCGSLGAGKLFDLVPDALARARSGAVCDVFGGSPEEIERWQRRAAELGVAERLRFLGRLPYGELRLRLREYRCGIQTMEGLKVVDYLEAGVVPILPRIPSFSELFAERDVAFYRPDDAQSLARAIDAQLAAPGDEGALRRIAEQHPLERRVHSLEALFRELSP
jgi:glycosyltransferase involved in cell wall biosynthesis